jgi:hypothetical protein
MYASAANRKPAGIARGQAAGNVAAALDDYSIRTVDEDREAAHCVYRYIRYLEYSTGTSQRSADRHLTTAMQGDAINVITAVFMILD